MSDSQPPASSAGGSGSGSGGPGDRKPDDGQSATSAAAGTAAPASSDANGDKDANMSGPPEEEELPEEIRNASTEDLLTRARMLDNDIRVRETAS